MRERKTSYICCKMKNRILFKMLRVLNKFLLASKEEIIASTKVLNKFLNKERIYQYKDYRCYK